MKETTFKLSQIIGETISSIRWLYEAPNEYGLQEFHSFIKLSNEIIIDFPIYDDDVFFILNSENQGYLEESFNKGNDLSKFEKEKIEGNKIIDLYFCYNNGEISEDKRAYLKLSNSYYITEVNHRPIGVNDIGLIILNQSEFESRISSLKEKATSYLNERKR